MGYPGMLKLMKSSSTFSLPVKWCFVTSVVFCAICVLVFFRFIRMDLLHVAVFSLKCNLCASAICCLLVPSDHPLLTQSLCNEAKPFPTNSLKNFSSLLSLFYSSSAFPVFLWPGSSAQLKLTWNELKNTAWPARDEIWMFAHGFCPEKRLPTALQNEGCA